MSIPYGGDTYPHYQGKYGLGTDIRPEYFEGLYDHIRGTHTRNQNDLQLIDDIGYELLLSRQYETEMADNFIEKLDELLDSMNIDAVTGSFLIELGFAFEDYGRMQVNGVDKRRTIEVDGEQKRINGDEQSFGTIVKSRIIGKVKFPSKQYTK